MNDGELWSFLRAVLSQGGDIQLDYQSGKYADYEEYSARLDDAARVRRHQFREMEKATPDAGSAPD
jgi:hypothetical protein